MQNPLPIECWALFSEDTADVDFKAVSGEEAMKTIAYHKLVRDKIPEINEKDGKQLIDFNPYAGDIHLKKM